VDIEATVRREWEVKARLEIDRQVQSEIEKLHKKFEAEVRSQVEAEMQKYLRTSSSGDEDSIQAHTDIPQSSVSTSAETDFPSTTDLSSLSIDSPVSQPIKVPAPRKGTRTPFCRAKTSYDSPMDVQMGEPSPMSIASLSLSPRRNAAATASALPSGKNIFTAAAEQKAKWEPHLPSPSHSDDEDNEDEIPDLSSPTRPSSRGVAQDPFKLAPSRPSLLRQKTAPMQRLHSQPSLFPTTTAASKPIISAHPTASNPNTNAAPKPTSPNRRLSKLPSATTLLVANDTGSPIRKGPRTPPRPTSRKTGAGGEDMFKAIMQRNMGAGGRTLVELAQARAGGVVRNDMGTIMRSESGKFGIGTEEEVVWDPERDEMPSPFLVRGGRGLRRL